MDNKTHEIYCNYNLTNLLTKLGFDWQDYFVAHDINEPFHWEIPLHIAQKWLREVKKYYIIFSYRTERFFEEKRYNLNEIKADIINKYPGGGIYVTSTTFYHTYEEAQEAGIKKACKIILEKGE